MADRKTRRTRGRRPPGLRDSRRVSVNRSAHGNVREAAAFVVERTLTTSSPAETFLSGVRERCDPRDHGLLSELVRGTLTWLKRIDNVLEQASSRPVAKIEDALLPPLRVGIYQLLFMDRVPVHAVVNEAVEHAHRVTHRGGVSFANGVLRRIARSRSLDDWPVKTDSESEAEQLAIEWSHPTFLVERWLQRFGAQQTAELLAANNRLKPLHLLGFRDRGGRELLAEQLIDAGLEVVGCDLAPVGLSVAGNGVVAAVVGSEPFRQGRCYIQDEASQVAALVPPPVAGELVLDLAAAPGGKLFSMIGYQPDTSHVGSDLSLGRLLRMRSNCRRLSLKVPLIAADAAQPPFAPVFDRVVVDAPCSGTGTLRKNPELRWRVSEEEIDRLSREGRSLLHGACRAVKPGGLLVWITCSLEREENEEVGAWFVGTETAKDFDPVNLVEELPVCLHSQISGDGVWRLLTEAEHDGFSVLVFRRRS